LKLVLNGEERDVPEGLTVSGLIDHLRAQHPQLVEGSVAVEVNARVIRKAEHASHRLAERDRIEVVTFVGGG
jgi:sulfur carrier protein